MNDSYLNVLIGEEVSRCDPTNFVGQGLGEFINSFII